MPWLLLVMLLATAATASEEDELDALFGEPAEPRPATTPPPEAAAEAIALPRDDASRSPSRPRPVTLEEIIVTAQKRPQSLADVPVSVTAVSGDKLQDAGIENLSDLSEYTPNFKLVDSGLIPNVYMRGVGSGSNQGFELSVGIFSDGIHLGRPHQTRAAFMDVERVEVLRGPQSILFGKNAIAGALNIVSARPGEEPELLLSTSRSKDSDTHETLAVVSGPLSEALGARLAVRQRVSSGDLFNLGLQRMEPGVEELAARLTLDWLSPGGFDTSLKLEKTERIQRGRTFQTTHPGSLTRCTGEDVQLDRNRITDATERAQIDAYNATLTLGTGLGEGELTLVSGLSGFESSDLFDADSSTLDTLDLLGLESYDQFSQEIRFDSALGETFEYIAGIFYQRGDLGFYEFGPTNARAGALADAQVCELNLQVIASADLYRDFSITGDAWSAFGQLTWHIGERYRLTAGLRYVQEQKEGYRRFWIYEPGTQTQANPVSLLALDRLLINEHELRRSRSVGVLLPSLNLQADVLDDTLAYLSFTRGAKSGSYDARNNNGNTDADGGDTRFEFDDELADAFELGGKFRLLEGAAELNLALFLVDYQDMQVSVYDGVAGFTVTNAGSARTQGIELDGRWALSESWRLGASLAYLDFEWLDYVDGPCYFEAPNEDPDTGTCDLTGRENQQTPRWTASLSSHWGYALSSGWRLGLTLDANYRGRHFTSGDLDPRGVQDAHTKFNTRLELVSSDERWAFGLLGKNISDELTLGIGAPTALDVGGYRATTEPGSQWLVDARYRF